MPLKARAFNQENATDEALGQAAVQVVSYLSAKPTPSSPEKVTPQAHLNEKYKF